MEINTIAELRAAMNARSRHGIVKRKKYSNKSCYCASRHWHQSILEADECTVLLMRKKSGDIKDYEIQHKISLDVNGIHVTNYYADFFVSHVDGTNEIIETKGFWTETALLKQALFKAAYLAVRPSLVYTVKYAKSKLRFLRKKS